MTRDIGGNNFSWPLDNFFDDAKKFDDANFVSRTKKKVRIVAINFVQKSLKSELSS